MTNLTIMEDPGEEFAFRGINTITGLIDDGVIFFADVTKVHVLPECASFTIQVTTPSLVLEMDFADADRVREALELFETKRVFEVDSDTPGAVRITRSSEKAAEPDPYGDPSIELKPSER
jgi:hypothetical protein